MSAAAGSRVGVSFTPTLAPMPRGILATCTARLREGVEPEAVRAAPDLRATRILMLTANNSVAAAVATSALLVGTAEALAGAEPIAEISEDIRRRLRDAELAYTSRQSDLAREIDELR